MGAEDVLEIIDLLERRGVRLWVDGGWGVDALLGDQTRPHADLDLAVELADRELYEEAVADAGFEFLYFNAANDDAAGNHLNWVVKDREGREIERPVSCATRRFGPLSELRCDSVCSGRPRREVSSAHFCDVQGHLA